MTLELVHDPEPQPLAYPLASDPRIVEYRQAREDARAGLSGPPGAHQRYRQAIAPYLTAIAENTPVDSPARRWLMRTLVYDTGLPFGAVCAAFRATTQEADWIAEQQPAYHLAEVDQIEALRAMPYRSYLRTSHWSRVRAAAIKRAENRCTLCNSTGPLEVHHRSYERLGAERPIDVSVLCARCHSEHHKRLRNGDRLRRVR